MPVSQEQAKIELERLKREEAEAAQMASPLGLPPPLDCGRRIKPHPTLDQYDKF